MTTATLDNRMDLIPIVIKHPDNEPKSIQIDRYKLQEFWLKGIVNDLTYVAFALELHDKPTLDLQQFSRDWSVGELSDNQRDEGLKPKTLKVRSILNAICVLDTKGMADCDFSAQVNQLSLFE